jgi:hypothetical protein
VRESRIYMKGGDLYSDISLPEINRECEAEKVRGVDNEFITT